MKNIVMGDDREGCIAKLQIEAGMIHNIKEILIEKIMQSSQEATPDEGCDILGIEINP
jgi:hypothetical protein